MNAMNRNEAIQAGANRYSTGKPCVRGHVAERYVSTMQCVECVSGHAKAWKESNPDKYAETCVAWRQRNPETVKAWKSASQKRNRAAANERQKRYHETHREKLNAKTARWQKANPARELAKVRRRQAAQLNRTPMWVDHSAINVVYQAAQIAKVTWPDVEIHVDHVVPLQGKAVSGLHVHENLRIIQASQNRTKSNHF